jgi:serine/threonine protein kinase/DNA-binding beta-propeller fold protein YncE
VSEEDYSGPGPFAVGSLVAGYRLEEQIGRGGMAVIYRARDAHLGRNVALKLLAPGLALDQAFRQRFIRESRAAAAVDHPHIIPIFAAGEANGVLFIAMRYVHGGDVRRLLDSGGPLPAARAADVITQVASALDAAHVHGLVHRDVKPANMLRDATSGGDHQDHVYLADFGLSKRSFSVTGLTSIGQFLGTPAYVAPEQIEGHRVDSRADQYALACASFEMLCGVPPFQRDGDLAVMFAQVSEPPPSLSSRRTELPTAVDGVMNRALAKSPSDRFPSCLAFAAALREVLALRARPADAPVDEASPPAAGPSTGSPPTAGLPVGKWEPEAHSATEISVPPAEEDAGTSAPADEAASWAAEQPGGPADSGPSTETGQVPPAGEVRPPVVEPGSPRRRRAWWRSRVAGIIACVIVAGIAGGAFVAGHGGNAGGNQGNGRTAVPLSAPGCNSAVASALSLGGVRMAAVTVGGQPFGVAPTADGKFSFVTLGNLIAVLRDTPALLAPEVSSEFSAPGVHGGEAITHDGRFLLAAVNSGAIVVDVAAAEQGSRSPVVGTLTSPFGSGAVEVAISPDDRFAFVTLQDSAAMVVFNLRSALTSGFGQSDVVGKISLGQQPVGMAISPDHRWLYATSMMRAKTASPSQGTITVIDLQRAEVRPSSAVVSAATAGCSPVRVIASPDGSDVWVTSRESDILLGFSAAGLRTDPSHSLIARVNVGAAPIGLIMVRNGSRILVANSNLRGQHDATSSVSVISTPTALSGGRALPGVIRTGLVPREFGLEPDGQTVLVTDNGSGQLQAIDVASLP